MSEILFITDAPVTKRDIHQAMGLPYVFEKSEHGRASSKLPIIYFIQCLIELLIF